MLPGHDPLFPVFAFTGAYQTREHNNARLVLSNGDDDGFATWLKAKTADNVPTDPTVRWHMRAFDQFDTVGHHRPRVIVGDRMEITLIMDKPGSDPSCKVRLTFGR